MNFCIIGGDLRNFFLAKLLSKEKNEVKIYGFDKLENIKECEKYDKIIYNSDIVILPIPFTKNQMTLNMPFSNRNISIEELISVLANKTIFVGNIDKETEQKLISKNNKVIDIMKKEEFAVLNAIPTAEATIEIILKNTEKILQSSNILIMGFGRIGKVLSYKLKALSTNVTCIVTSEVEKAWATVYGYDNIYIDNIKHNCSRLRQYDIIINTIPKIILRDELKEIRKETLIIDLASKPYGIDRKIVEEEGLNFIEALGLPREISANDISKIHERHY